MRIFWVICSISLILVFVFVAEYIVVENFFDELRTDAENMKKNVVSGTATENDAVNIVTKWERCKGKLYIFENHEYFKNLEENVYNLKFSTHKKEQRNMLFALEKLIVFCNESEYDFALSFGNIF